MVGHPAANSKYVQALLVGRPESKSRSDF